MNTNIAISSNDCLQPFYFQEIAARGAIVKLSNSFVEAINGHTYPLAVNALLGQSLAATALMSTHLKFSARLSLQARSLAGAQHSPAIIDLMLAETQMAKHQANTDYFQSLSVRGLCRLKDGQGTKSIGAESSGSSLSNLLGPSQLAVTIEPNNGERYQGIVNAQSEDLTLSLEDYFRQSEQLDTYFVLCAGESQAAGLILQEMPNHGGKSERCPIGFEQESQAILWEELSVLGRSIKQDELFNLTPEDCLKRLFHQHSYALGEPAAVKFECSCSPERTANALLAVSSEQLEEILSEDGEIVMDCEFCSARYRYDRKAIENLEKSLRDNKID